MKVHAWLSIISERRTPEELCARLRLERYSSWKIGDLRKHTTIRERKNGWVIESGLPEEGADVEVHLEQLIGRIRRSADKIREIAAEDEVAIQCAIYTDEQRPLELPAGPVPALGTTFRLAQPYIR